MIVFDLDKTLRCVTVADHLIPDDITHTSHWIPWQHHVSQYGPLIEHIAELYVSLCTSTSKVLPVAIVTSSQFGTAEWLQSHGLPLPDLLVERQPDDHRSPHDYKWHWITHHAPTITLWVDDDEVICDCVEKLKIPVVRVKS